MIMIKTKQWTRLTCSKMVKMLKMFKDAQSFRSASKNITSNGRQTASTVVLCGKTTIKKFSYNDTSNLTMVFLNYHVWLLFLAQTKGWRSKRQLRNSLPWLIYFINSVDKTELFYYPRSFVACIWGSSRQSSPGWQKRARESHPAFSRQTGRQYLRKRNIFECGASSVHSHYSWWQC